MTQQPVTVEEYVRQFRSMRELHEVDKTGDRIGQECFWLSNTLTTLLQEAREDGAAAERERIIQELRREAEDCEQMGLNAQRSAFHAFAAEIKAQAITPSTEEGRTNTLQSN